MVTPFFVLQLIRAEHLPNVAVNVAAPGNRSKNRIGAVNIERSLLGIFNSIFAIFRFRSLVTNFDCYPNHLYVTL